jgi:hypothetical protein
MGLLSTIGAASARAYGFTRSAIAAAVDAYFNRVTLLLPGNGTNGAQNNTFLDSSSNTFTITRNGNTTQGTFSPFSQTGWSNFCNTPGTDYLNLGSNANFSFGTGIYTIEFFVYRTANGSTDSVFASIEAAGTGWYVSTNLNAGVALNLRGTGAVVSTNSYQIPLNTWTHVVITRASTSASQTRIFINGVLAVAGTDTTNWSATGPLYLMTTGVSGYNAGGYLSNVRLIKGSIPTAYQTSSTTAGTSIFTPPTSILSTSSQGATSGNVSLLTCQSNRFVDNSSTNATITLVGTPSVQAFSPFAPTAAYSAATVGGSGYFDGNGDYLSIANTANLQFGSGDFTLEFFVYFNALSGNQTIYDKGYTGTNAFVIQTNTNTGTMIVYANGTAIITASSASPVGQWDHYAVVRSGTTITLYRNGVSVGSATNSVNFNNAAVTNIGAGLNQTNSTYTAFANAYISNVRLVKGSAVYTAPFTPPTAPHTAITNTQLLLNFTNGGIVDATGKNVLETVGNAQISTTQSKFGGSSMYFDGNGDYLNFPSSQLFGFGTGDFTIEFWLYLNTVSGTQNLCDFRNAATTEVAITLYMNGASPRLYVNGADRITGGNLSTGQWYHVALARSGTSTKLFVDGTQSGSTYTDSNNYLTPRPLRIGTTNDGTPQFPLNAYVDDFRITRYARYTANFSAPTAAFPLQ